MGYVWHRRHKPIVDYLANIWSPLEFNTFCLKTKLNGTKYHYMVKKLFTTTKSAGISAMFSAMFSAPISAGITGIIFRGSRVISWSTQVWWRLRKCFFLNTPQTNDLNLSKNYGLHCQNWSIDSQLDFKGTDPGLTELRATCHSNCELIFPLETVDFFP